MNSHADVDFRAFKEGNEGSINPCDKIRAELFQSEGGGLHQALKCGGTGDAMMAQLGFPSEASLLGSGCESQQQEREPRLPANDELLRPQHNVFNVIAPPGFAGVTPGEFVPSRRALAGAEPNMQITQRLIQGQQMADGIETMRYSGRVGNTRFTAEERNAQDGVESRRITYEGDGINVRLNSGPGGRNGEIRNVRSIETTRDESGGYDTIVTTADRGRISFRSDNSGVVREMIRER
jgi:hypothetical protein